MKNKQTSDERLESLEILLAHQQRLTEELDSVIVDQSKRITKLERMVLQLQNQQRESQLGIRDFRDPLDEKPPHY